MMRSTESASSVFYHSQEEDPGRSVDREALSGPLYDSYQDSMTDGSPVTTEQDTTGKNLLPRLQVRKVKPKQKCQKAVFSRMTSRGRLLWLSL